MKSDLQRNVKEKKTKANVNLKKRDLNYHYMALGVYQLAV